MIAEKSGILKFNENKRLELNGRELTCGEMIDVYVHSSACLDGRRACGELCDWIEGRIEHDGSRYFLQTFLLDEPGARVYNLEGREARRSL